MKTMPRLKRFTAVFALASLFAFSANAFAAVHEEGPGSMVPGTPLRDASTSQARGPVFAPFVQSPAHVAATVTSVASGAWSNPATWDTGVPGPTDDVVIGAGTTVTIDTTPITVNSLTVNGTLEYDATLRAVTVTTNVSIAPGGTLQTNTAGAQTGHTLTVGGNLTNDGTLDLSTSANTSGARLTFTGAASNTFGGTGATTDLRTLTINKGTSNANILEITTSALSVQGTVVDGTPMAYLTITNGTLKISGAFVFAGRTFTAAAFSIPATGGFWLNNPNYTVSGQNGSPTLTGLGAAGTGTPGSGALLRISAGTLNIGTSTGNSMGFGNNAIVIVEGGAVNATGRFGVSAAANNLTYTQTGGVITVCTIGNASSTLASFDLGQGVGPDVVMSGGTVIFRINCTGVPARDYRNQQGNTALGITNTVLQFGDAGSGVAKTFNVEGLLPNVVVSNASAGHTVLFRPPTFFNNSARDVTINPGCTYNIGNQIYLESGNTVTNDGTLTANGPSARFIWFQAGGNGTYQGAGVSTGVLTSWETQMANLTMSQVPQLVVRRIIIFVGNILNSNKLTLGDGSATLNAVQIGNTTTPTAAGTFDVAPTFNLGTGGQQISYLRTTASRSTGPEVNPGRALVNLTYDDNDVTHTLTIAGGDLTVSGTTALTNGRVITGANTLVANGAVTRTTGYVDGLLQKPVTVGGPVARTFEVGDAAGVFAGQRDVRERDGRGRTHRQGDGRRPRADRVVGSRPEQERQPQLDADELRNHLHDGRRGVQLRARRHRRRRELQQLLRAEVRRAELVGADDGHPHRHEHAGDGHHVVQRLRGRRAADLHDPRLGRDGWIDLALGQRHRCRTATIRRSRSPPDPCYMIADVTVDGGSVGAVSSYTFTNVQAGPHDRGVVLRRSRCKNTDTGLCYSTIQAAIDDRADAARAPHHGGRRDLRRERERHQGCVPPGRQCRRVRHRSARTGVRDRRQLRRRLGDADHRLHAGWLQGRPRAERRQRRRRDAVEHQRRCRSSTTSSPTTRSASTPTRTGRRWSIAT